MENIKKIEYDDIKEMKKEEDKKIGEIKKRYLKNTGKVLYKILRDLAANNFWEPTTIEDSRANTYTTALDLSNKFIKSISPDAKFQEKYDKDSDGISNDDYIKEFDSAIKEYILNKKNNRLELTEKLLTLLCLESMKNGEAGFNVTLAILLKFHFEEIEANMIVEKIQNSIERNLEKRDKKRKINKENEEDKKKKLKF
jgi:hypothetical protein